jgi:hypothetical protein
MKTALKYIMMIVMTTSLLTVTSCKKTFYTSVNNNPDALTKAPLNTILPVVETGLAYVQGGNQSLFISLFTQQTLGVSFQAGAYYEYTITSQDIEQQWDEMYINAMENDYTLMNQADASNAYEYSGIARIIMAYCLQTMVDCWGNIPYSQAFQGANNLHPTYDNAQTLYGTIGSLLSDGLADLAKGQGAVYPTNDDVIYGGSIPDWEAFASAISARIAIHQSKGNTTMSSQALTAAKAALTGSFVNADVVFGTASSNENPWYQFEANRSSYISFNNSTLANKMISNHDPRFDIFVDSVDNILGNYYGSPNSPVEFITTEELLFIEAEATVNTTGAGAAVAYYDSAIATNMEKLGIANATIATYISNNQLPTSSSSAAIAQIGTQEWIALYLNPEAWTVWRRTNSPSLNPVTGSAVPRRFLYPQDEISYNSANTPSATQFTPKIFWDN